MQLQRGLTRQLPVSKQAVADTRPVAARSDRRQETLLPTYRHAISHTAVNISCRLPAVLLEWRVGVGMAVTCITELQKKS